MKYLFKVPATETDNFMAGPVIFREDGKAIAFANVHGVGEACVKEIEVALTWEEDNWAVYDEAAVQELHKDCVNFLEFEKEVV